MESNRWQRKALPPTRSAELMVVLRYARTTSSRPPGAGLVSALLHHDSWIDFRMQPGHTERLAEIYEQYRRALVAMAVNILGCRHRAEDAVHDAFARVVQSQGLVEDPVAYCFRAVRNAALNVARKNRVQQRGLELYQSSQTGEVVGGDDVDGCGNLEVLVRLIESLPPDQRELILLKIHANLTFVQIGEIQNVPMKTVATRYRRVIEALKAKLEQVHES